MSNSKHVTTLTALAGLVFAAGTLTPAQAQPDAAGASLSAAVSAALPSVLRMDVSGRFATAATPPRLPYVAGSKRPHEAYGIERASATPAGVPTGRYFVELADAPVVRHLAGAVTGIRGMDAANSTQGRTYAAFLEQKQAQALQAIESSLRRPAKTNFRYVNALNGFSMALSPGEAARVRNLDGVVAVTPVVAHPLLTDAGPQLIGAPGIWDGSAGVGTTLGEGIVVGILDTGINSDHPSFDETAGAYTHTNPLGTGVFRGYCVANPAFCNDKLIGAYDFVFTLVDGAPDVSEEASPEDNNSHGSHTAGTVAGNPLEVDFAGSTGVPISGVAPRANIVAFDICYTVTSTGQGLCPGDASVAAIEQAIADGDVDVINFSIGGGNSPYTDPVSQAFLSATEAGIFVAASAGNSGPDASTVSHQEPWVSTTGASTHNRVFANGASITGPGTPPVDVVGIPSVQGSGPALVADIEAEVEYAGEVQPGNAEACTAFTDTGAFTGKIALVSRGACNFSAKVDNAAAAGAVAVIVHNNVPGAPLTMSVDGTAVPSVMVRLDAGLDLAGFIASNPAATLRIDGSPARLESNPVDTMAAFSSRGPSSGLQVMKPDVTAPGVNILAAVADGAGTPGVETGLLSGTSMSGPHNAGAGALLRALKPSWSAARIKSALMLSADTAVLLEDEATPAGPFAAGNGRIAVAAAANVGLVMDETTADYEAANPADGGDPRQLNLASLYSNNCIGTANCTFTRTFTSVAAGSVTWDIGFENPPGVVMSVDVPSFTLAPGASQAVVFTADADGLDPADGFAFGKVLLTDSGGTEDPLHMAVALQASDGVLPDLVRIDTRRDAGSMPVAGLVVPASTDLTFTPYGMVEGTVVEEELAEDSANGSPFDNLADGVYFTTFTPTSVGARLVAEITNSESPDLDLFIGLDFNLDGLPGSDEIIAFSATATALERAEYLGGLPVAPYWILVQNWEGSASQPDAFTLSYAFVPAEDQFNLGVEAPAAPAAGVPFDIRMFFDEPQIEAGDRWYGAMDVGPDPGAVGQFGLFPVDLVRHADDVLKLADTDTAQPGDTVTYTISVQPNVTQESMDYLVIDSIPAGMSYVPGSAVASAGTVNVVGSVIQWSLTQDLPSFDYDVTDNTLTSSCAVPLANSGGYTDLAGYGLSPGTTNGEGPFGMSFAGGTAQVPLYGVPSGGTLFFGANGLVSTGLDSIFAEFDGNGTNAPIPTAALPNALMAMLWNNMVIDTSSGSGVSLANLTSGGVPVSSIIEFDNLILASDGTSTIDAEVFVDSRVRAGFPEIVFAYDNVTGGFATLTTGTIGIEDHSGTAGVELAYNDAAMQVADGYAICFDLVQIGAAQTLTFEATVDGFAGAPREIVNIAQHTVDNPGSTTMTSAASLIAFTTSADLAAAVSASTPSVQGGQVIDYTVSVSNAGPDLAEGTSVQIDLPSGFAYSAAAGTGWSCVDGGSVVTCSLSASIAGGAAAEDLVLSLTAGGAVGPVDVVFSVSAVTFDPDSANNAMTVQTNVLPAEDFIFGDGFEN